MTRHELGKMRVFVAVADKNLAPACARLVSPVTMLLVPCSVSRCPAPSCPIGQHRLIGGPGETPIIRALLY